MFNRLLVPLDGSDHAETALPYALEIIAGSPAELLLACVSDSGLEQKRACQSYLDSVITRLQHQLKPPHHKSMRVSREALQGNPAREIVKLAERSMCAAVVVASRGRSGAGQWPLGGVASKVLQKSRIPVLLVRGPQRAPPRRRLVNRIMLPLDTSESGAAAVPYAIELARLLDASIVLFHVEPQPVPWLIAPGVEFAYLPPTSPEHQARKLLEHTEYLNKVAGPIKERDIEVEIDSVSGSPAAEISNYAAANKIDLIALSSHGQTSMSEFVYGGVAEKLIHYGDIPLLVVRPGGGLG